MEIMWPRIILGGVLTGIWAVLRLTDNKKMNPKNNKELQDNLEKIIRNSSTQTALLTAGLLSLVLGI